MKAAVFLLLASSSLTSVERNNFVQALDVQEGGKFVRIELQKHWIPHVEFEDLEEDSEEDG